jgi:hypothetical protein
MLRVVDLDLTVFAFISNYTNNEIVNVENLPVFPRAITQIKKWVIDGDRVIFVSRSKNYDLCRRVLILQGIHLESKYVKYTFPATKIPHFIDMEKNGINLKKAIFYDDDENLISEAKEYFKECVLIDSKKGLCGETNNNNSIEDIQRAANKTGHILTYIDDKKLIFSKL